MNNRIYSYILLGISLSFSTTGYTQKKPIAKPTSHTTPTSILHTKTTKSAIKSRPENTTITKPSNNKNIKVTKSIDKKTTNITVKSQKPKQPTSKIVPASSSKTQAVNSAKLKKSKIDPYNKHKTQIAISGSDARKHTILSAKSLKSENFFNKKNKPENLTLEDTKSNQIIHENTEKPFRPFLVEHTQATKINTANVSIETSLFLDGLEAGLSKELILQLTDIFAWDIDFATNLRPGDHFTIVYEKKIIDGKETENEQIIAAEFINQGSPYTAVRYINESGVASFYTPDGQSMQRAFLTTPVDFAKISSPFDMHRMHPILNRIRAHKGIDYAARIGTPVKTTGDGVVSFSGNKGAYGQVVIIQHNDHYETLYAHMSEFRKGLIVGNHVKQGDVIGYVGQSGLATGPHLHYEFHVDGLYRDPDSVKIPHSMPISDTLLADFNAQTQPHFAQLNQVKAKSLYAKNHSAITPSVTPPASLQQLHFY